MAPSGFDLPDFTAPLDVAAHIAAAPEDGTSKGMFFSSLVKECEKAGKPLPDPGRFVAFKDYPLREYLAFAVRVAQHLYPEHPLREGLRRLGWLSFPTLAESMIGRVVFGVLGPDMVRITKAAGRGYEVSGKPGHVEVLALEDGRSHLRLNDVWSFVDCMQVGVFEGCLRHFDFGHEVHIRRLGLASCEMHSRWWRGERPPG